MSRIAKSWAPTILMIAVAALAALAFPYLSPAWREPGHRDIAIFVVVVVLLGLRVEIRSALAAVVNQMLPQIQASNAFSDSVNERFATTAKEHEQLLERVISLEGHERRISRIEHHLDTLPFPLRLPPEERTGR
jgi:hypothetical protein